MTTASGGTATAGGGAATAATTGSEGQTAESAVSANEKDTSGEQSSEGVETSSQEEVATQTQEQIDEGEKAPEKEGVEKEESTDEPSEMDTLKSELDKLKKEQEVQQKANERLYQIFEQFPEIPGIIKDLDKGADPTIAFARHLDLDAMQVPEGDPNYQEWEKARNERQEKLNKDKEFSQKLSENIEFSKAQMDEFKAENNLSEERAQEFFENVNSMLDQVFEGRVDKKILGFFLQGMTAKEQAEEARKQGELKARNEKIEAKRKEEAGKKGDGLPGLNKGDAGKPKENTEPVKTDPWASAFDKARTRQKF